MTVLSDTLKEMADHACDLAFANASEDLKTLRGGRMCFYPVVNEGELEIGVGVNPDYHYLIYQNNGFASFPMTSCFGKAQPLDSQVLTPSGFVPIGSLSIGDAVIGGDGRPTSVIGIYDQGVCDVYDVEFYDGTHVFCTKEHLWSVKRKSSWVHNKVMELSEFMDSVNENRKDESWRVDVAPPIEFDEKKFVLDPYFVGCMIGDGSTTGFYPYFSCYDEAGIKPFVSVIPDFVKWHFSKNDSGRICLTCFKGGENAKRRKGSFCPNATSKLIDELKRIGLWNKSAHEKEIPEEYMHCSIEQRVALLQGLMDTDGSYSSNNECIFHTVSKTLAEQVRLLVLSLGGLSYVLKDSRFEKYRNSECCYKVYFNFRNDIVPFRAMYEKKLIRYIINHKKKTPKCFARRFKSIAFYGEAECRCILVENEDGLYITNDYVVTHNTIPMFINGKLVFRKCTGINQFRSGHKNYWQRDIEGNLIPVYKQRRAWVHPGLPPKNFIEDAIDETVADYEDAIDEALFYDKWEEYEDRYEGSF